jgi:hypothetical protein
MVSMGAAAIGALMMGGLADYIGLAIALGLAGGLGSLTLVIFLIKRRKTITLGKVSK